MADRTEALVLQMSADITRMTKALNAARGQADRQLGAIEARFSKLNSHVQKSGDAMSRDLRASLAAIGVASAIREVTQYSDAWTGAQNKIAAAGVSQRDLARTMSDLADTAKSTGTSFEATADLYSRVQRNAGDLGLTQQQVLTITERVNQAFIAGGAAAGEQASGILQLGQALGSGVLQGDELKALRENAPELARAIADEFGVAVGKLKELGAEGKLSSDRVAQAILNATGIQEKFAKTTRTVEQSMENLRTEFTRYVGQSKVLQTATQALGGFIQFVTDNLEDFADAAVVAASVLGGALAAGAIVRLGGALLKLVGDLRDVKSALEGVRVAATFFSGPIGAAILALGGALLYLANSAARGESAIERFETTMASYRDTQKAIRDDTDLLTEANKRLRDAMAAQADAAEATSTREVNAIERRLRANEELAKSKRAQLQADLNAARKEFESQSTAKQGSRLDQFMKTVTEPFVESKIEDMSLGDIRQVLGLRLDERGMSEDQFRDFAANTVSAGGVLDDADTWINEMIVALDTAAAKVIDLETQLLELDGIIKPIGEDGGSSFGTATQAATGYQTALEKLTAVLDPIRKAHSEEASAVKGLAGSYETAQAQIAATADDTSMLKGLEEKLGDARKSLAEADKRRSREALQAISEYAGQVDDLSALILSLPSIADMLSAGDLSILKTQIDGLIKALNDSILVGEDKLRRDYEARMKQIQDARAAAAASGDTTSGRFDRAEADAYQTLQSGLSDLWTQTHGDQGDLGTGPSDAPLAKIVQGIKKDFGLDDLTIQFENDMRDAVRNAMRDGIRSGDWGDAFKSVLAEAVTQGLDSALNRVADWLSEFLFAKDGFLSNIINGAMSWGASSFGGFRAAGGPVMAGKSYVVGENGPELLRMGAQSGQILNAAQMNGMIARGGGGAPVINMSLNVQGSIDAVTWPKVQASQQALARQIMSAVPSVVNATITDNRVQKRRL